MERTKELTKCKKPMMSSKFPQRRLRLALRFKLVSLELRKTLRCRSLRKKTKAIILIYTTALGQRARSFNRR